MTKAKKVLSLALAVVMVAAMFAFAVSAADLQIATFTVSVDKPTVTVGEDITVTVALTTDYYVAPTQVPVYYDPAVFTFVEGSVSATEIFGAGMTNVTLNDKPDETGCLRVGFDPDFFKDPTAQLMNGTLFTFKLHAVANGTSDIALHAADQKTATNVGGPLYCGAYESNKPTLDPQKVGQEFRINNTTATVGAAAQPEIVAKAGTTGFVDAERMYVYGVTAGDVAANYFEATNGGTLAWDLGTASNVNGTGATVTLKDSTGVAIATYTLIIFGDIDGDAIVNLLDDSQLSLYTQNAGDLSEVALFAADVNADGSTNLLDSSVISLYTQNAGTVSVNPYAS